MYNIFIILISYTLFGSCSSDLKINATIIPARCTKSPDLPECQISAYQDPVDPSIPSGISITEGATLITGDTINITYTNGSDNYSFSTHNIKACTDSGCSTGCVGIDTDTASPSSISGLLNNETYYACVQSVDSAGRSSSWASGGPIDVRIPPAAPASFEPLPGFTREGISMSWTAGDGEAATSGYIIYRQDTGHGDITWTPTYNTTYTTSSDVTGDSGADSSSKIIYAGSDLSTIDSESLEDNKTYMYKIFAYSAVKIYSSGLQRLSRTYPYQTIDVGNEVTCATKLGRLRCWGDNTKGQLGYGHTDDIGDDEYPYEAGDISVGKEVLDARVGTPATQGYHHVCALTVEGKLRCWGYGGSGRLGTNDSADLSSPPSSDVPLSDAVIMVDTGQDHSCALTNRGEVKCFGASDSGQLGYDSTASLGDGGTEIEDLSAIALPGSPTVALLSLGEAISCAVTTSHKGRCWGRNSSGALGQDSATASFGTDTNSINGIDDIAVGDIVSISTHNDTTCAVTSSAAARCWGDNNGGRLGYGNETDISNGVTSISSATDIDVDASDDFIVASLVSTGLATCIVNTSGQLKCWGQNNSGQAGYGDTTVYGDATDYPSGRGWHDFGAQVIQVAGGASSEALSHTCALTETGEIYCWGNGEQGALGHKSTDDLGDDELASDLSPVPVWGPVQSSPDRIRSSNLIHWYDAADQSTLFSDSGCSNSAADGGGVGCWKDKKGSDHLIQATADSRPLMKQAAWHGQNYLEFDGSDDSLSDAALAAGLSGGQAYSVFIVLYGKSAASTQGFFHYGTATTDNNDIRLEWDHANGYIRHSQQGSGSNMDYAALDDRVNDMHILTFTHNGGTNSASNKRLYMNGVDESKVASDDGTDALALADSSQLRLGSFVDNTGYFTGYIGEVIIYDTVLAPSDRQAIEFYLRAKWQKGVDGIASTELKLHLDPMKQKTLKTDSNATSCNRRSYTTASEGDDISCVLDRSSAGNDAGQATISKRPTLSLSGMNSRPSLSFVSANAQTLVGQISSFAGVDTPFTLQHSFIRSGALFSFGINANKQRFTSQYAATSASNIIYAATFNYATTVDTSVHMGTQMYKGTAVEDPSYRASYLDGIELTPGAVGGNATGAGSFPADPYYLVGSNMNLNSWHNDMIGEILFYGRELSSAEVVENSLYAQLKWGILDDNSKAPGGVDYGLTLWIDADDSTALSTAACSSALSSPSDGESLGCLKDKSGLGNHLSSDAGSPTYETGELNGRPVIRFSGAESMSLSDLRGMAGGDAPFSVFVVASRSQTASTSVMLSLGDNNTAAKESWQLEVNSAGEYLNAFNDALVTSSGARMMDSAGTHTVLSMSYNGSGVQLAANQLIYENGALLSRSPSGSSSGDAALAVTPKFVLGAEIDNTNIYEGDISELVIYNRLLSDHERQAVEAYLAQKWLEDSYKSCLDVPSTGTYLIDPDGYNGPMPAVSTQCNLDYASCKEILDDGASTGDGLYIIDPDGSSGEEKPLYAYCDMSTDGGGWTMVVAQYEGDPVTDWNEGTQSDYDPSLASYKGFALSSQQMPPHSEMGIGQDLDPTLVTYFTYTYTTGDIAKTSITGADGYSYWIHRDAAGYYDFHNPDSSDLTADSSLFNTLTVEGYSGGSYTAGDNYTYAFCPLASLPRVRGYAIGGSYLPGSNQFTTAWTIWVR